MAMLNSFVHKYEHHAFCGVVCGYLGFEEEKKKKKKKRKEKKRTTPKLR
jgi:hypothetical protein